MRYWVLVFLVCAGLEAWHELPFPTLGELAPREPVQTALVPGDPAEWYQGQVKFKALARYTIRARILSREPYFLDQVSDISNLDLALGWGRMSDPAIYNQLGISQSGRWYEYHYSGLPPIPAEELIRSSANTHIIPANLSITSQLFWFREGDVIQLSGYLVQATWPNGATWVSSLSRTDTGDHSCEVMWVDAAYWVAR